MVACHLRPVPSLGPVHTAGNIEGEWGEVLAPSSYMGKGLGSQGLPRGRDDWSHSSNRFRANLLGVWGRLAKGTTGNEPLKSHQKTEATAP